MKKRKIVALVCVATVLFLAVSAFGYIQSKLDKINKVPDTVDVIPPDQEDFETDTQAIHCGRKHIPAIHFPQPGIKILGSMNSFMRWGLILQLSQKKPLSRHSNWRRNGNPLTGRSSGVNHIHYPRKYHAVTAAALIAEKNKYPRRIGAVENMIHP